MSKLTPSVQPNFPVSPTDYANKFRSFFPLSVLVAARNRIVDAMRHVTPEHFFLDTPERGTHGRYLRDDIDAIAVLVDHLGQAANLALDPAQTFLTGCLDVFSHVAYIPLQGMGCKCQRRVR